MSQRALVGTNVMPGVVFPVFVGKYEINKNGCTCDAFRYNSDFCQMLARPFLKKGLASIWQKSLISIICCLAPRK